MEPGLSLFSAVICIIPKRMNTLRRSRNLLKNKGLVDCPTPMFLIFCGQNIENKDRKNRGGGALPVAQTGRMADRTDPRAFLRLCRERRHVEGRHAMESEACSERCLPDREPTPVATTSGGTPETIAESGRRQVDRPPQPGDGCSCRFRAKRDLPPPRSAVRQKGGLEA